MKKVLVFGLAVALAGSAAVASDMNFSVRAQSNGTNAITVSPGETVAYEVVGWLTNINDGGLALVGFDLEFSGGDLAQADTPTGEPTSGNPMPNFVRNLGITNPAGYGGTVIGGNLVQVCGGQNTILNYEANADFPIGAVIENIAHGEVVLVTGSLTAPGTEGVYTLSLTNPFANVIKAGEDGIPFWATEAAGTDPIIITNEPLTITTSVPGGAQLISSAPACNDTLPRYQNNVIRLTFDGDITAPSAGELLIQEAQDSGAFGVDDHSGSFTFTVENDGGANPRVLKIVENGDQLGNETWYAVHNTGGWSAAATFEVKFVVVYGDADNSGATGSLDITGIWSNRGTGVPDDSRYDIDGNGSVGAFDVSDAWGFGGSADPGEPSGHLCP